MKSEKRAGEGSPPNLKGDVPEGSMLPIWRRIHQEFTTRGQKWPLQANAGMALMHLMVHPDDDEPAKLAAVMLFPRQTMTSVLDTLEARGLVVRAPHPNDRRRIRIELTPKGRTQGDRMLQDLLKFEAAALESIPAGSRRLFQRLALSYADALTLQNATTVPS